MRRLIPLSTLLACGPLAPSADITSTTDETTTTTTTATTNPLPDPTTTIAATTTTTASTTDPTSSGTTLADVGTIDCDLYAQDCPPGQKCVAGAEDGGGAWDATRCVDIIGDAAPGEPCTTMGSGPSFIDDCALGAICWDVDETHHGTCIALCAGSWDAPICPPQSICSGGELLNLCIPTCHPLLQDCPGDDLCIPNLDGTSFTCVLDASRDEGQANDPCEFLNACDKGLMCLEPATASSACDPGSTGCCTPFCTFPNSPCPNPDQQCVPFFNPMTVPPGYESVGVCAIPT